MDRTERRRETGGRARRPRSLVAGASMILGLQASIAAAQGRSPIAEGLFNDAQGLYEAGRLDEACPKFRESDRIEPAVGTKLNLAACEEARGRIATAWAIYRIAAEQLGNDDPRRTFAVEHREALAPRVPRVTIRLAPDAPSSTTATIADIELAGAGFGSALPLDPGRHPVRVVAPDRQPATFEVVATESAATDLVVSPGAPIPQPPSDAVVTTAPPPDAAEPAPLFTPLRIGAVVAGGVGLVSLGVAGVFTANAVSKNDESANDCDGNLCGPAGKRARLDAISAGDTATVAFVLGTVFLAGGAVLWIVGAPDAPAQLGAGAVRGGAQVALRGVLP